MPFKVTDFGSNRKPMCDFLLVINTSHLAPFTSYLVKFVLSTGVPVFNTLVRGESLK